MKDTILTTFTSIGVVLVLAVAAYFPFVSLYEFILKKISIFGVSESVPGMFDAYLLSGLPDDPVPFKLKITIAALVIALIVILLVFLVRKACKSLDLRLFKRILSCGMFYVGTMTILMLAGMWLDMHVPSLLDFEVHTYDFARVGFIFYLHMMM